MASIATRNLPESYTAAKQETHHEEHDESPVQPNHTVQLPLVKEQSNFARSRKSDRKHINSSRRVSFQESVLSKEVELKKSERFKQKVCAVTKTIRKRQNMLESLRNDLWCDYNFKSKLALSKRQVTTQGSLDMESSFGESTKVDLKDGGRVNMDYEPRKWKDSTERSSAYKNANFESGTHSYQSLKMQSNDYYAKRIEDMTSTLEKFGPENTRTNAKFIRRQTSMRHLSKQPSRVNVTGKRTETRAETLLNRSESRYFPESPPKKRPFLRKLSRRESSKLRRDFLPTDKDDDQNESLKKTRLSTLVFLRQKLKDLRKKKKDARSGRFLKLAKFVVLLFRSWRLHSLRVQHTIRSMSADAGPTTDTNRENIVLLFDRTIFKAEKKCHLATETKRVLRIKPNRRTSEELHHLQVALMEFQMISEYPIHMQQLIAERAWYEVVDADRVITREGQRPMYFFFILSGTVLLKSLDAEENEMKDIGTKTRGEKFGDEELIAKTARETTVVAKETVELLCLSDTDFIEIFMSGGLQNIEDPFFKSVSCLEGWPLHLLAKNPDKALFNYFRRGSVLVDDSSTCEWLYIIRSGSCRVLKQLKARKPDLKRPKTEGPQDVVQMAVQRELAELKTNDVYNGSHQQRLLAKADVEHMKIQNRDNFYHISLPEINIGTQTTYKKHVLREKAELTQIQEKATSEEPSSDNIPTDTPVPTVSGPDGRIPDTTTSEEISPKNQMPSDKPPIPMSREGTNAERPLTRDEKKKTAYNKLLGKGPFLAKVEGAQPEVNAVDVEATICNGSDGTNSAGGNQTNSLLGQGKEIKQETKLKLKVKPNKLKTRNVFNKRPVLPPVQSDDRISEPEPVFVTIQTLTKGSVFGLTEFVYGPQASLCLVSNGAECILINKKFYAEHAPQCLMNKLRNEIYPYPSENELQNSLQTRVNWEQHKSDIYKETKMKIKLKKNDLRKARPFLKV